jgi:large subunit ribosomal protein L18
MSKEILKLRAKRVRRVRAKIHGTSKRPRLSVFRSNRYISAQLFDDDRGITILTVSDKQAKALKGTKTERAEAVGKLFAERAKKKKVKSVIFDRGAYRFHGRVKAFAEGARAGGLKF